MNKDRSRLNIISISSSDQDLRKNISKNILYVLNMFNLHGNYNFYTTLKIVWLTFSCPSLSMLYWILQPNFSNNGVKFALHLMSPQLNVKNQWKGPKFSSFAIISNFTVCQYLGVPLILSNTVNGSLTS